MAYIVDNWDEEDIQEIRKHLNKPTSQTECGQLRGILKKILSQVTRGLDMSPLFADIVKLCATVDIPEKKLAYLYMTTYAHRKPDLALLAVNTMQKDCKDANPMIRGLALKTLCSLRLPELIEYTKQPLLAGLRDKSAYVRRAAVLGCLKINNISPQFIADHGIINMLYEMLRDGDVIVVINCMLALEELLDHEGGIAINQRIAHYLVNRLSEFTEWGQCCVLQLLLKYTPQSEDEMFDMMNVVDAFLKHTNSGVCMAAVRLMLHLTTDLPDISKDVYNRLKGPLLNLLSSDRPELVYTALCHLEWFNTRLPGRLAKYYKKFYCRYNDPGYVKYKKIELLSSLCSEDSLKDIVEELSVYAIDISIRLSHLAVAALGKLANTSIAYSGPCVEALLTLLSLQIDSVSSQVLVVFQDILRYEHLKDFIPAVVERLPSCEQLIQEPCGKAALVGLIAQYGQDLPDAPYILESMIDTLEEERNTMVKLSLLTATIKLFFIRPAECQDMLGKILEYAIECESNADLQEKAKMYYRLLSKDVQKAKDIISAPPSRLPVPCPSDTSADVHHFNSIALLFGPDRWREIQKSNYGEENEGHSPLSFVELKPNDGELELDITATGQLLDLDGVTSEFNSEVTPEVMLENEAEAIPVASTLVSLGGVEPEVMSTLVSLGGVEPEVMSAVRSDGVATETVTRVTTEAKFLTNVSLAPEEFEGKWTTWKSCELQELKIMKSLQPKDIQRQLEELGCKTMATTPEDSAPWRAFLYAKEDHTKQLFLIEVALDLVNDLLTFDIRCDEGQTSTDQAALVVKKLLLDAVS
ncbi:AP-4 complex subunit beta-1-like isoform X3 [Asterias rubens]|uniref:AP-4 complex subunit beta-1-like isoform X2 n=1 Tax=Asterias rubens TaxID=7604 RepID=UPI0014551A26|nr:AP-4 complex subunit beta-1-like isoform X2 [Asterias rubens]XP_033629781.1 AP-4 complex subunit beta-1-like isoform X3 [Asterias rubens]